MIMTRLLLFPLLINNSDASLVSESIYPITPIITDKHRIKERPIFCLFQGDWSAHNIMQQIKQVNEFANVNRTRDKSSKELAPVIEKIEAEFAIVLSEARQIKDRANEVLKFESEKLALQKYIKEVKRGLNETNNHLATVKAQGELMNSKLSMGLITIKDEVHSLQRTIQRRQEYFQAYDKKLNNIMDTLSKNNSLMNDRMYLFQEKFRQLTKETLEMTKDIKRDFDATMITNQVLKNELVHRIRNTEEKEKILDLYMSQREEIPKKITEIYQDLKNCLRHHQFHEFKVWHQSAIEDSLSRANKMVDKVLASQSSEQLKNIHQKMAGLEELKLKTREIEEVKQKIEAIGFKIDSMQKSEDHKIAQIREEAEEIEEKIIEVIDKKIDNIEEEIQHYNNKKQESIEEKFNKMREEMLELIQLQKPRKQSEQFIDDAGPVKIETNKEEAVLISRQLQSARKERQLIENHSKEVKAIADTLNSKLSLFNNKITMCRSDVDIFTQSTSRQLKKILQLRRDEENHMESIGKVLAKIMQSLLILTSLSLCQSKGQESKSFVSYHDGILLQLDKQARPYINYRKNMIAPYDLKESLVLTLLKEVDQLIMGQNILRWDKYKPSSFFGKIKENMNAKSKTLAKSPSVHLQSPRRRARKGQADEDLMFDLKMQSQELLKTNGNRPTIAINSSNILWTCDKPKSQMQKRYKIKRHEDKSKKQIQQRNCFTASRSHRKAKIVFN